MSLCASLLDDPLSSLVNYYGARQYWQHVASACDTAIASGSGAGRDLGRFWRAVAGAQIGRDTTRELDGLRAVQGFELAATAALLQMGKAGTQDSESINELKKQLKASSKTVR